MNPFLPPRGLRWMQRWRELSNRRLQLPAWFRPTLMVGLLILAILLLSPYWTLWRLSRAAGSATPEALTTFVDLNAVRQEIRHRLNKDKNSHIGEVSDPFIEWMAKGLKSNDPHPVETLITLEWIAELLHDQGDPAQPLVARVHYAFYDFPDGFLVKLTGSKSPSTHLLLQPRSLRWRVVAVYY